MIGITTGKIMNSPYNHQFSYDHHNHYKVKSMFKMIWIKKYDGLLVIHFMQQLLLTVYGEWFPCDCNDCYNH